MSRIKGLTSRRLDLLHRITWDPQLSEHSTSSLCTPMWQHGYIVGCYEFDEDNPDIQCMTWFATAKGRQVTELWVAAKKDWQKMKLYLEDTGQTNDYPPGDRQWEK